MEKNKKKNIASTPKKENKPDAFAPLSNTDIDGSYTGLSQDGSAPVQDADDL